nr:MAG TPA: hypothetical protein [Caudoviricetes sp.]
MGSLNKISQYNHLFHKAQLILQQNLQILHFLPYSKQR